MKTKKEKYLLFSKVMGNGDRTIESHDKEGRPYIKLLEYFSKDELEELIETGKIDKLDTFMELSVEYIELIGSTSISELKNILINGSAKLDKEKQLKDTLYKVEIGMEKSLILPIFKEAIGQVEKKYINETDIKDALFRIIKVKKLGMFSHENHKTMTLTFIEKYLTKGELLILANYYKTSKN
jgi:predicted house-cleaning noncanonical NTP pyrophosphatase (MazG superfamily)